MYVFTGKNPTKLYYDALIKLVKEGDKCSPRGKLIKELRPACFEFENPYNRVTFLGSRRINSFFQIAESLWIISGRADVGWLTKFNGNMAMFSDDGKWFNAPYGERIRSWNKNALHGVIINPVDQLVDAYHKLLNDKDTRQAVIVISNPMFDNSKYTIGEKGKDIACNLVITFKIRYDELHMTVFNRSNDCNWGTFGANLCQFSTIQEVLLNWLKNSGSSDFVDLKMGTYCQITDSLHIYLDDYGAKCTNDVLEYYKAHDPSDVEANFTCKSEPRMSLNSQEFDEFLSTYWTIIDPYVMNDEFLVSNDLSNLIDLIDTYIRDDYWKFGIKAMVAYRLVKLGKMVEAMKLMDKLQSCQWKISMMYFLKHFIKKLQIEGDMEEYQEVKHIYRENVEKVKNDLINAVHRKPLIEYLMV